MSNKISIHLTDLLKLLKDNKNYSSKPKKLPMMEIMKELLKLLKN